MEDHPTYTFEEWFEGEQERLKRFKKYIENMRKESPEEVPTRQFCGDWDEWYDMFGYDEED